MISVLTRVVSTPSRVASTFSRLVSVLIRVIPAFSDSRVVSALSKVV